METTALTDKFVYHCPSHIDNKYRIDVDDLYEIEDILSADQKEEYRIVLSPVDKEVQDEIYLGYLKLSALK